MPGKNLREARTARRHPLSRASATFARRVAYLFGAAGISQKEAMSALAALIGEHAPELHNYVLPGSQPPDEKLTRLVWHTLMSLIAPRQTEVKRELAFQESPPPDTETVVQYRMLSSLMLKLGADEFTLQDFTAPSSARYEYLIGLFNEYFVFRQGFREQYKAELVEAGVQAGAHASAQAAPQAALGGDAQASDPSLATKPAGAALGSRATGGGVDLAVRVRALKTEITALTQEDQELDARLALAREFGGDGKALVEAVSTLRSTVERAEAEADAARQNTQKLEDQLAQLQQCQADVERLVHKRQQADELRTELATTDARVASLRAEEDKLRASVAASRADTSQLQTELSHERAQRQKAETDLEKLQQWWSSIDQQGERDESPEALRGIDADIAQLEKECRKLEADMRAREQWLKDMAKVDELGKQLEAELAALEVWARG